jgi:hypothetical protein
MSSIPRLNGAIRAFETGNIAFTAFCPPDTGSAQAIAAAPYDAVVIEMEHNPFDVRGGCGTACNTCWTPGGSRPRATLPPR